jgi:hypothetical protein
VGPGNFGPAYSQVMDPQAGETIKDPHNFILDVWATSGLFALLALLATLALFFVPAVRTLLRPAPAPAEPQPSQEDSTPAPLRWEYYVGGMMGILLGFIFRVGDQPSAELLWEAIAAGIRAVVWFAAFGLLELVPWTPRTCLLALTAGAAALLLNLCVSGGIGFPSVAGPFWVVLGLGCGALALATQQPAAEQSGVAARAWRVLEVLPLPVFVALTLAYLTYVLNPVTSAMGKVRQANDSGKVLLEKLRDKKGRPVADPIGTLRRHVIRPLQEAAELDPDNARIAALLATWYGRLWGLDQMSGRGETPQTVKTMTEAMNQAVRAQKLDPGGREGYLAEFHVRDLHIAPLLEARARDDLARKPPDKARAAKYQEGAREQYRLAAEALRRHETYDPTDPTLHYLMATALDRAGDKEGAAKEAHKALEMDAQQGSRGTRHLSDRQRHDLDALAGKAPAS